MSSAANTTRWIVTTHYTDGGSSAASYADEAKAMADYDERLDLFQPELCPCVARITCEAVLR